MINKWLLISINNQTLTCFEHNKILKQYVVSTGKNGPGEWVDSGCTPRGWHQIYSKIGETHPINAVMIARKWTNEIYSSELALAEPGRDWILTRILQLQGLEIGRNLEGDVDTLSRYVYIHGTPDETPLGQPGSKGCIRMNNNDLINFFNWVEIGTKVCIE
jgi:hypothetical protein